MADETMDEDLALALALQAQEEEYAGGGGLGGGGGRRGAWSEDASSSDEDDEDARQSGRNSTRISAPRAEVVACKGNDDDDDGGDGGNNDNDGGVDDDDDSKRTRGTRDGRAIMVRLLELGHVRAGEGALTTTLRKAVVRANLEEDGRIVWKKTKGDTAALLSAGVPEKKQQKRERDENAAEAGETAPLTDEERDVVVETLTFNTVSEFRLAVARVANPERKVDNGWDWVKFDGVKLGDLKKKLPPEPKPAPKPPRQRRQPKVPTPKKRRKKMSDDDRMFATSIGTVLPAREKRASRNASKSLVFADVLNGGGDLQMVTCEKYASRATQPFKVTITSAAELVMDFHAHLCSDEIIGFLGGVYDADEKTLRVTRALPARQLKQDNAGVEVELDPESVPDIVETLTESGERIVGWYHSHPVFATHPSVRDIENQVNYQAMFDDGDDDYAAPFVGAIVGPYDVRNDSKTSDFRMFHCVQIDDEPEPYELKVETAGCTEVPPHALCEIKILADRFRLTSSGNANDAPQPLAPIDTNVTPVSLTEHWRDGTSRLDKFSSSISARCPKSWSKKQRDAYVGGVMAYLKSSWGLS
jgi:proteasome lid subunit RPN8/RPN11